MASNVISVEKTRSVIHEVGSSKMFLWAMILYALSDVINILYNVFKLSNGISSRTMTEYSIIVNIIFVVSAIPIAVFLFLAFYKTYLFYLGRVKQSGLARIKYILIAENCLAFFHFVSRDMLIWSHMIFACIYFSCIFVISLLLLIPFIKAVRFAIEIETGEPKRKIGVMGIFVSIMYCVVDLIYIINAPFFEEAAFSSIGFDEFWITMLESGAYLAIYVLSFIATLMFLAILYKVRASTLKPKKTYNKKCRS